MPASASLTSFMTFVVAMIFLSTPIVASAQATTRHVVPGFSSPSSNQPEVDAMRSDLAQMRVILNQMSTNLASVSDSQSPLKHQFQLDIEMWQVLMMQMQRRIDRLEGTTSDSKPAQSK